MGALDVDTAVEAVGEGRFRATLSAEWEIWGPMGGYLASTALRAIGGVSPFTRPASFFCHYLAVAAFDTIDIEVTTLRQAKTAAAHRARVTQDGKPILEATVWSVGDVDGLEHDVTQAPDVPGPDDLRSTAELLPPEQQEGGFAFWRNLDEKPVDFRTEWPPAAPLEPTWQTWCRFRPTSVFEDPWVDACRSVVLIDVQSWPAASRAHVGGSGGFIAPMLDLYVAFHQPAPQSEWLLLDGHGPIARDGLMAWNGRLWSESRCLVASGTGQMLCRRVRPG